MTKYPKFDTQLLYTYIGKNPLINQLHQQYCLEGSIDLSDFENEYLIKNFRYSGYKFDRIKIDVFGKTAEKIKEDYNITRDVTFAFIDKIIGETDIFYHVSCDVNNGTIYFWLYKEEVGDLYEIIHKQNNEVDFNQLNLLLNNTELHKHQETGIQFLLHEKKGFLYDTVGAGKTYTAIGASIESKSKKVLIICLSGKKIDWKRELKVWNEDSKIINGWNGWIYDDIKYTIINFDIIHKYNVKNKNQQLLDEKYDCVIIDEIHRIKNPSTKRSKTIAAITAKAEKVYGLSATPIEKNEDFYNICRTLNISISDIIYTSSDYSFPKVVTKYEEFLTNYCNAYKVVPKDPTKQSFWIKGKKTENGFEINSNTYELHQRIKHKQRRRKTENVIEGFPEKSRTRLWFNLNSKQNKEYKELFDNYLIVRQINKDADSLLLSFLKVLSKAKKGFKYDSFKYECLNKLNSLRDSAVNVNDGHEKIINKHIDSCYNRLILAIEKKENIELTPQEYKKFIKSLSANNLEQSRELIETILLRQYLAIQKVSDTISQVKFELEDGYNCLVFTHFKEEFELLSKAFGDLAVLVKSGTSAEVKQKSIDEFMNNPKKRVIIGNIFALGTGNNITKADVVIFNCPNWNGGEHEQAEGRAWRIGRKDLVTVYYMIFENTIEEKVFEVAESKKVNTSIFLGEEFDNIE